jgi:hypothetical protein
MPMRGELSAPTMRAAWQKQPAEPVWRQIFEILWSPDLIVVIALAALGLAATICVSLLSPSFANIIG